MSVYIVLTKASYSCFYILPITQEQTCVHTHILINNAAVNLALLIPLGHSDFHCFGYILGLILDSTLSSVLVF